MAIISKEGTNPGLFFVRSYGIDWFDEIVRNDDVVKSAGLNLSVLDKRLDELEAQYGIKRTESDLNLKPAHHQ